MVALVAGLVVVLVAGPVIDLEAELGHLFALHFVAAPDLAVELEIAAFVRAQLAGFEQQALALLEAAPAAGPELVQQLDPGLYLKLDPMVALLAQHYALEPMLFSHLSYLCFCHSFKNLWVPYNFSLFQTVYVTFEYSSIYDENDPIYECNIIYKAQRLPNIKKAKF